MADKALFNAHPGVPGGDQLVFENAMVLAAVQALVGAVTPAILAVGVSASHEDRCVDLWFALSRQAHEALECIDDVVADMTTLTDGTVRIESRLWVGPTWIAGWPGIGTRLIYAIRPD